MAPGWLPLAPKFPGGGGGRCACGPGVCVSQACQARSEGGAVHPGPREARQWLVLFVGIDLIGTNMYADVVDVQLEISDGIIEPVDASVQG